MIIPIQFSLINPVIRHQEESKTEFGPGGATQVSDQVKLY